MEKSTFLSNEPRIVSGSSARLTMWGHGTNFGGGYSYQLYERRTSRRVILTMEVTSNPNVYSTMFEHKHSQIADNGTHKHTYKKMRSDMQ